LIFSNFFSSGGIFCILFFAVEKKDEPARLEGITKLYLFRTVLITYIVFVSIFPTKLSISINKFSTFDACMINLLLSFANKQQNIAITHTVVLIYIYLITSSRKQF